jgi:hypothetical protein
MVLEPEPISAPSDTSGALMPKPRKDKAVSASTVPTTPSVNWMISSEPMLGMMWRMTIRSPGTPMNRAAAT